MAFLQKSSFPSSFAGAASYSSGAQLRAAPLASSSMAYAQPQLSMGATSFKQASYAAPAMQTIAAQPAQIQYAQPAQISYAQPAQISYAQPAQIQYAQPIQQAKPAAQSIKGESRIEYIPYERKEIEYEQVEKTVQEQVPVQKIEYQTVEKKIYETVPKEKIVTDYQAIEYQKEYVPRTVYDTVQEQVPVQTTEYVPVQKTEYVPQQKTEYVTQSKQVERTEYDEVEYQVQRPDLSKSQVAYAQPQQLQQAAQIQYATQTIAAAPQTLSAAPLASSQIISSPLQLSQANLLK